VIFRRGAVNLARLASPFRPVYDGLTGWYAKRQPERIEAIMFYRDACLALFIDGANG
jgi:hypothetical protein